MTFFQRQNFPYYLILLVSVTMGVGMITYGLPYSLHPDESYIFKDAMKNAYNYSNLEFIQPMNLYSWLLIIWYGIVFLFGKLTGEWISFEDFKNLIVLEDGKILFYGRLLSVCLVAAGNYFLYKIIKQINASGFFKIITFCCFVFNPILLSSVYWIKFDAASYCASAYLFLLLFDFFVQGENIRNKIYIASIVSLSVRVEFAGFLVTLMLFDFLKCKKESIMFFGREKIVGLFAGILLFCVITFYPASIIYNLLNDGPHGLPLASQKTFEKAISSGILREMDSGKLFESVINNLYYFFLLSFFSLGIPIVLFFSSCLKFFRNRFTRAFDITKYKYLYFYFFFFLIFLTLFPYHATHYFLSASISLLFVQTFFMLSFRSAFYPIFFSTFNLIYMLSISMLLFYHVMDTPDTRISAQKEILSATTSDNLLAIETISMNGYNPLINECPEVLRAKANAVRQLKSGTGLYYELKAKLDSSNCKKVLDVFNEDYFAGTTGESQWINTYNTDDFIKRNADFFITTQDLNTVQENNFYKYILSNYALIKFYYLKTNDLRLQFLIKTEPYFKNIYIYKHS